MSIIVQPQLRRDARHGTGPALMPSFAPRGAMFQFGVPALFAMLGIVAMAVDMPLARFVDVGHVPDGLKKAFDLAEVFAHGYGALTILIAVWVLAPERRRGLPRVLCGWIFAGLLANVVKMTLSRRRPLKLDDLSVSVFQTFEQWFPWTSAGSAGQAFPSGHTTTAVALAIGLAWLIPRGRWLFATFALMAAMQRMASGYHYLSDTLWGAALGWFCAAAFLPGGWMAGFLDRLDRDRLQLGSGPTPHVA
jgi:membrane-associated phospholipid phosphatase